MASKLRGAYFTLQKGADLRYPSIQNLVGGVWSCKRLSCGLLMVMHSFGLDLEWKGADLRDPSIQSLVWGVLSCKSCVFIIIM